MSYDINIQLIPAAAYAGGKFYAFGQKRSLGVRGIQKLVNMFAKYLLTPVGSDPLDLSYGTVLTNLIGSNIDAHGTQELLQISVEKTVQALHGFQLSADVPNDERLATATVTAFLLLPEAPGFAAQIFIQNIANQGLTFLLPTLEVRTP